MRRRSLVTMIAAPALALSVFAILKVLERNLSILAPTASLASKYNSEYLDYKGTSWFGGTHPLLLVETAEYPPNNHDKVRPNLRAGGAGWEGSTDLGVESECRTDPQGYKEALVIYESAPYEYSQGVSAAEYVRELSPLQVVVVRLTHLGSNPFKKTAVLP